MFVCESCRDYDKSRESSSDIRRFTVDFVNRDHLISRQCVDCYGNRETHPRSDLPIRPRLHSDNLSCCVAALNAIPRDFQLNPRTPWILKFYICALSLSLSFFLSAFSAFKCLVASCLEIARKLRDRPAVHEFKSWSHLSFPDFDGDDQLSLNDLLETVQRLTGTDERGQFRIDSQRGKDVARMVRVHSSLRVYKGRNREAINPFAEIRGRFPLQQISGPWSELSVHGRKWTNWKGTVPSVRGGINFARLLHSQSSKPGNCFQSRWIFSCSLL